VVVVSIHRVVLKSVILGTVAVACAQPEPAAVDTAAIEQAIQEVRDREIGAVSSGDVEALLGALATDAHMMAPNEPAVTGHEALRAWAQAMLGQVTMSGRYTSSNIEVAGDYVIERYTAELTVTPKAGGATTTETIKGIHIYRRQADGSWKIAQDVWNADAPPPAAPPTTTTGQQ
jgi:ketosteroid isomerase-like protein